MEPTQPSSVQPLGDSVTAVAFIQSTSLFKDLPDAVMTTLYEKARVLSFGPSDVVIAQDSTDTDLFVIVEGDVVVQKWVKDQWLHLAELERPAIFGEVAALTQQPRAAAVVCKTDCTFVQIPGPTVRAIAESTPKLGKRLAMLMSARDKDTERKIPV